EIATDREQHVILLEHLAHIGREADHCAAEQWMRGGKRRGARHEFGIDGRAQKLRELDQFRVRAAVRYRIARDDHGMLCFCERRGRRFYRCPIPPEPRRHATRSGEIDVAVGAQDISGKRQEDGPGGRCQCGLRRPMHEPGQIGQTMHLGGPFDQRARDGRKISPENRLGGGETLLVLAGVDENGRAGLLGAVELALAVPETGGNREIAPAGLPEAFPIPSAIAMTAASCSPSKYRSSFSVANASISGNSVVPGLPNMISTPSCLSRSRKARFPDMTGKTISRY